MMQVVGATVDDYAPRYPYAIDCPHGVSNCLFAGSGLG